MSEPRGIEERIDWFLSHNPSGSGMCAQHVWHSLGGDYGNPPAWGCDDANECVDKVKASGRYWTPGTWEGHPPRGAWVGWKYGANGHAALSLGDGTIATTDPSSDQGMTGIEDISWPQKWGAGSTWSVWSDQYAGVRFDVGTGAGDVWTNYSGKPSGTLTISNAQDYVSMDFVTDDPPSSGLELHLMYVNCELTWGSDDVGIIRVKYRRDDGDDTAYQDYCVPKGAAIGSPDTFLLTATHWESGEKGKGGRWYLRCEGGITSVKLGTRYSKIAVIS
jgi:hypothetical protein